MTRIGTGDAGAEVRPLSHRRDRAENGEGIPAFRVLARPDGVNARHIGGLRNVQCLPRSVTFGVPNPRVMTEIEREAHARKPRL